MAKTWVLDTETKGTGAHIAPLRERSQPVVEPELELISLGREPRSAPEQEPAAPLSFKVVDVLGARVLAEDVDVREALALLAGMRSVIDARVYVWNAAVGRWRLLTLSEQRALWQFRDRISVA